MTYETLLFGWIVVEYGPIWCLP